MTEVVWKVFYFAKSPRLAFPQHFSITKLPECFYPQLDYEDYELKIFTTESSVDEVEGRINYHFTEISSSLKNFQLF